MSNPSVETVVEKEFVVSWDGEDGIRSEQAFPTMKGALHFISDLGTDQGIMVWREERLTRETLILDLKHE